MPNRTQAQDTMPNLLDQPLNADVLIERARRNAGVGDFGDTPFREGLQVFLRACAEEAELSLFGRFATRWDIGRFLSNLLRLREAERRGAALPHQPVEKTVFM